MSSVEKITSVPSVGQTASTDAKEPDTAKEAMMDINKKIQTADLFSAAGNFFNQLTSTLSDEQKTKKLISSLVEIDQESGKKFLKVPIENEQINQAADFLSNLLSSLKNS